VPQHRVSRVDVAVDFAGDRAWSTLRALGMRVGRAHKVKRSEIVPDESSEGRTLYIGSRTSPAFCRIYEKGKQVLSGKEVIDFSGLSEELRGEPLDTWVRAELEVKPKAHIKSVLSQLPPENFWGVSEWSCDVYRELGGSDVPRISVGSVWRADDYTRTVRALVRQYGRFLERMADDLGAWDCVGLQLREELAELRKVSRGGGGG
jgi:DNA relaxase NicK